jgi:hypothetical protein
MSTNTGLISSQRARISSAALGLKDDPSARPPLRSHSNKNDSTHNYRNKSNIYNIIPASGNIDDMRKNSGIWFKGYSRQILSPGVSLRRRPMLVLSFGGHGTMDLLLPTRPACLQRIPAKQALWDSAEATPP